MQIKITVWYNYTPIRMAQIQDTSNTKCCQGFGAVETLFVAVGMQNSTGTLEGSFALSYKI